MTLEILTSDALSTLRHGFFTRRGGASSGVYKGLNCGTGSTDQSEIVQVNRARVADALQIAPEALIGLSQVHSTTVITVDAATTKPARGDALVTATPGLALSILTADCQPVLFADQTAGVIGAAHAGWRGALDGVLEATLDAMETLGATRANTTAIIGPSISQSAYEVSLDFMDIFLDNDPDNGRFFAQGLRGRVQFDLPAYGLYRLRTAGVGHAEWSRHCTYNDPDRFYSYRRTTHAKEADYGRLISAIRL